MAWLLMRRVRDKHAREIAAMERTAQLAMRQRAVDVCRERASALRAGGAPLEVWSEVQFVGNDIARLDVRE